MPQDANQPRGWRGDGNQPKRTAKYGWKPKAAGLEKSLVMRRITQVSLALSVFMCLAVIVYMLWQPRAPKGTSIIIVGARPSADAINLQAPLDFHGWQGCIKLKNYVKKDVENAEILPEDGDPFSLTDETLEKLKTHAQDEKTRNQVIIYFGLVGFAGPEGPCLFGSQGKIVKVKKIIDILAPVAKETKRDIVLLFDAARLPVAPELGVLRNDFVRSLEETWEKIADKEHLAVICSSGPGERAWNSDEWGCSVFLQQVIEALRGAAKRDSDDIQLSQFFETVRDQTRDWSKLRYLSQQEPRLFANEKMNPRIIIQRNKHEILNDQDKENAPGYNWADGETPNAPVKLAALKKRSDLAAELAKSRPHPAVYTPLSWRRYRELLVRLEQAQRMSDKEAKATVEKLVSELDTLWTRIKGAQELKFKGVAPTNTIWPVVLATTPSQVEEASLNAKEVLKKAPVLTDPPPQDAENHLAFKLAQFWANRPNGPSEPIRKLAIETRQLAERAALACEPGYSEHFYSERLWEMIQPELSKIDEQRRIAEDYLFSDNHANADFAKVKQQYDSLLEKYQVLQSAWATYHYAVSEASFLTKWHVYCAEELQDPVRLVQMQDLWKQIHQLEKVLNNLEKDFGKTSLNSTPEMISKLTTAQGEVERLISKEMKLFSTTVNDLVTKSAPTQIPRHRMELLLSFAWPIPKPGDGPPDMTTVDARLAAVIKARQVGTTLHLPQDPPKIPETPKDMDKIALYRGELINSMLKVKADTFDGSALSSLNLGSVLAGRWRNMSVDVSDKPKNSLDPDETEEQSRYALSFLSVTKETALDQRDVRWKKLLNGHAKRICLDHWYDDGKVQYFKKTAQLYLDDYDGFKADPDDDVKKLLGLKLLQWKQPKSEITWTSELKRDVPFEVESPPEGLKGRITLWAKGPEPVKPDEKPAIDLSPTDSQRQSKPLTDAKQQLHLEAKNASLAEKGKILLSFEPKAYFRGQDLTGETAVTLIRNPSLIVTEQVPNDGGTFTLTAADNLRVGLGHLAIVLDYSGSMRESGKDKDGKILDEWWKETSRIQQAIKGLNTMLLNLNKKVDNIHISIRIFSEMNENSVPNLKGEPGSPEYNTSLLEQTKVIKSTPFKTGVLKSKNGTCVFVTNDQPPQEIPLARIIDDLKKIEPFHATPLLESMKKAKDSDAKYASSLPGETVTLLVLTDGADTSKGYISAENDPRIDEIRSDFVKEFDGCNLSIQMVLFTSDRDADKKEVKIAKKQFRATDKDNIKIHVHEATNLDDLEKELMASFQVKMQVTKNGHVVHSLEKNDSQHFIAQPVNTKLGELKKSPDLLGDNDARIWINDKQRLSFNGGDHLFIKLKDANNKVQYTRELFKDVWKRSQPDPARYYPGQNSPWHLTVAENTKQGHLRLTLEHEHEMIESTKETVPVLAMYRPHFVWWNVMPPQSSNKDKKLQGTVHVTKLRHYYAPAWDIDQSPNQDEMVRVEAWVSENAPRQEPVATFTRDDLKNNNVLKLNNEQLAISFEEHTLADAGKQKTELTPCLVVRYRLNDPNQRLWFETNGTGSVKRWDHLYFPEAKTMTVYFSPFKLGDSSTAPISLKMVNLDELTKASKPVITAEIPMNMSWPAPNWDTK